MEFLVSEGMSEGTWPFLGQKNSCKISSGPTSGESSICDFQRLFSTFTDFDWAVKPTKFYKSKPSAQGTPTHLISLNYV